MKYKHDTPDLLIMDGADAYLEKDPECGFRTTDAAKKKPNIIAIVVLSIFGLVMLAVALFNDQLTELLSRDNMGLHMLLGFGTLLLGGGVLGCLYNLIRYLLFMRKMKACTQEVSATIVMIKRRQDGKSGEGNSRQMYFPVYSYYYNGRYYIAESDEEDFTIASGGALKQQLGTERTIMIDPASPYTVNTNAESKFNMVKLISCLLAIVTMLFAARYIRIILLGVLQNG